MRVDKGAAIKVRAKDPMKRPGRLDKPRDTAPSSRNGNTTKYALNICSIFSNSQFQYLPNLLLKLILIFSRDRESEKERENYEEEA